jgi:hypothetical protein
MSHSKCQEGDTTGFPIKLSQSLHSTWPATSDAQGQLKKLTVPTDFSIQWGPPTQGAQVSVRHTTATNGVPGVFQISGISTITDSTTLTYGSARYSCSGILSIVQNQHPAFCSDLNAQYEVILAFQIKNKEQNPSSPDIILVCRPIVFSDKNTSSFWPAVDEAAVRKTPQNVAVDMSTMFGFDSSTLMPMITYQTCLPVKILNYNSQPYFYGSLRIRVNVVQQPIHMVATENGLGKCSSIRKYTLVTSGSGPVSIFNGTSSNTILQFRDGYGSDLFPNQIKKENLVPSPATSSICAFDDIMDTLEIQVPESLIGKSLAQLADTTKVEPVKGKKKAFKCYSVDPLKDIKGDQIMIDPTTGERLKDILEKDTVNVDGSIITGKISYVLYGNGITGEIPVQKFFPVPKGNMAEYDGMFMFLAQDTKNIKAVVAQKAELDTSTENSTGKYAFSFTGDLSKINKVEDLQYIARDSLNLESFTVKIGYESQLNLGSSGILPGDIEDALVIILIVIGSILLFSYSGYILHMWFYQDNGFSNSGIHVAIFVILLGTLIVFATFSGKSTEDSNS